MYFDPGTGSLIIQAIVAALAVCGGYFAIAKTKLKNLFTKKNKDADTDADKVEPDDVDDAL